MFKQILLGTILSIIGAALAHAAHSKTAVYKPNAAEFKYNIVHVRKGSPQTGSGFNPDYNEDGFEDGPGRGSYISNYYKGSPEPGFHGSYRSDESKFQIHGGHGESHHGHGNHQNEGGFGGGDKFHSSTSHGLQGRGLSSIGYDGLGQGGSSYSGHIQQANSQGLYVGARG